MDPKTFELFLISCMRSAPDVDRALTNIGVSGEDAAKAGELVESHGFCEVTHKADLYRRFLGNPVSVTPDITTAPESAFYGSNVLHYQFSTWPEFDFTVREDKSGFAWGLSFERRPGASVPLLEVASSLRPWSFVTSEVNACFSDRNVEDAWNDWEDISYQIPEKVAGPPKHYLLQFDFKLLQNVMLFE